MAGDAATTKRMTAAEFLEWERLQLDKHEFHDGEVFAMAGGSARHNFLAGALTGELRSALRGTKCGVLTSDQRISAQPGKRYVYADVVVVCGGTRMDAGTTDVLTNPSIIVEVLSKRTERYDRGEKWGSYQRLPSLTDYLLVAQGAPRVEHYRHQADGSWRYGMFEAGATITLANGSTLTVDSIYENAFDYDGEPVSERPSGADMSSAD